jgi:hypothetical protein
MRADSGASTRSGGVSGGVGTLACPAVRSIGDSRPPPAAVRSIASAGAAPGEARGDREAELVSGDGDGDDGRIRGWAILIRSSPFVLLRTRRRGGRLGEGRRIRTSSRGLLAEALESPAESLATGLDWIRLGLAVKDGLLGAVDREDRDVEGGPSGRDGDLEGELDFRRCSEIAARVVPVDARREPGERWIL